MTIFSHRKLQLNKYTATMAGAARRSTKVSGGAHKLAVRPAHGSTSAGISGGEIGLGGKNFQKHTR